MKISPQNSSLFSDPCFHATVQKLRLVDYVILLDKMMNISTVNYFNFLKLNTVLRVLFALITVNKDLE